MDRPRLIRGLRIAFSVVCGILCLLMIALWVRSYWWRDAVYAKFYFDQTAELDSERGKCALLFLSARDVTGPWVMLDSWRFDRRSGIEIFPFNSESPGWHGFDFFWFNGTDWSVFVPHWFLVVLFASATAAPWIPWSRRFGLRTLLIAVTLVALVFGAVALLYR